MLPTNHKFEVIVPLNQAIATYHIYADTPEHAKELYLRGEYGEFMGTTYVLEEDAEKISCFPKDS